MKPVIISLRCGTKWIGNDDKDGKITNCGIKGHDGEAASKNMHVIKFRHMGCPGCDNMIEVTNLELVRGAQFSNLTCPASKKVTSSKCWKRDCKHVWHKCSLHLEGSEDKEQPARGGQKRKRKVVEKGVDKPLPKLRRIEGSVIVDGRGDRD